MKKIFFAALTLLLFLSFQAFAFDTRLIEIRNKFFAESQEIKSLLPNSKDAVLLASMFDSCVLAISQIDAHFSLLGVLDSVKEEIFVSNPLDIIVDWINSIKKTNELNINNLNNPITQTVEANTKSHIEKLKVYFNDFDNQLKVELNRLSTLKKSLEIRAPKKSFRRH